MPTTDRPTILLAEPDGFSQKAFEILESFARVSRKPVTEDELIAAFREYDIIWLRLGHRIRREMLDENVRCSIIACPVTGLDHIDLTACADFGIAVVSLRGEREFLREVRATAELTIGLILALIRRIPGAVESVRRGEWNRDSFQGTELYRKTAGIVGMGRLGSIVAGYLEAMGMKVVAYDPNPFDSTRFERSASLHDVLAEADVVSLHVAYDESTHHLFSEAQFASMKRGSILVNTSRGGIVESSALLSALESGQLSGAALDVVEGEPDVSSLPLIEYAKRHDNLLIVPHIGGNTGESFEKTEVFIADRVQKTWETV